MISRISCRYLSKKSIQAAEAIEATLTLFKLSDVSYIAVIQSESFNSQIDLEDLSFDDKTGTCLFNSATNDGCSDDENNQCILSFNSQDDYQFAKDIYDECVHICNNVLSLNSMIRDFYVSGIRNSIGSKRNLLLSHEILKQFSTSSISEDFLFSDSQPQHNSLKAKGKVFDVRSNAKCFYCSVTSAMDCVRKFVVHPYVPQSSKSVPVVMCLICLENWKEYRDKAEFENELILADQVNEEICALCSDTPPELILCDVCPRSYCHNCLEKIVGPEAINDIVGPSVKSAWKCFPCRVGYIKTPPLSKSYWVYMDGPSSSSSSGKSTGVRGKMNSASTKDPDKDEDLTLVFEKAPKPKRNIVAEGEYLVKAQLSTDDYQTRGSSMKRDRISKNKLLADGDHVVPPVASTTEVTPDVRPMPCTTQSEAELFYFSQYVKYFDNLDADCSNHPSKKRETDDACYLCKDGGDLIVCDWKRNRGNLRCLKCYHETCLSYSIPDNQVWICMRHFCMSCGEKKLKYMCKFCSNSICADCPEKVVEKVF